MMSWLNSKQNVHFENLSVYAYHVASSMLRHLFVVAIQQTKVGVWLQLSVMSLGYNALEGTLPDSWKLNKVTKGPYYK